MADVTVVIQDAEPALEDDTTARLFELRVRYVRNQTWSWLTLVPALALVAWGWTTAPLLVVAFSACLLVALWQVLSQPRQPSQRWVPAARRLLADEPWRETLATVLATRGTVLALPGGDHVRVYGLPAPAREVVVRTGRVRLVGPDAGNWLAVRVDGLHTPWPARVVPPVRAEAATPAAGPVVAAWTRQVAGDRRGDVLFAVPAAVGLTALCVVVGDWRLVALTAAAGAGAVGVAYHRLRKANRLRAAGGWRQARAAVSWTNRGDGTADGTAELTFPDGHRYTAHLDDVPVDLLATAWREETLWVADGGVVGFPDYPLAAFARLTPVAAESPAA